MTAQTPVTLEDIREAAKVIRWSGRAHAALTYSRTLSEITGAEVWIKFENMQFTASFKERGAFNRLSRLTEAEKQAGIIAMSAGNHAQGVAYHAKRLGIPTTIVMPVTTPFNKIRHTEDHGAKVILFGENLSESLEHAKEVQAREGYTFIHPFDDKHIIAGQGTIGIEMLEDQPDLDMLVVPVGGGGLIGGIATAAKAIKPDIRMIGVEAAMYPAMQAELAGEADQDGRRYNR